MVLLTSYLEMCALKNCAVGVSVVTAAMARCNALIPPTGYQRSGRIGLTRSSAQPQASLTTHGKPLAIASLTTNPQVSLASLGRTRQSAATYARLISDWFKNPTNEAFSPL